MLITIVSLKLGMHVPPHCIPHIMMGSIMYLHQAIKQDDSTKFMKAMVSEVNNHVNNKHWKLIL